jgi:hypothetical protein
VAVAVFPKVDFEVWFGRAASLQPMETLRQE